MRCGCGLLLIVLIATTPARAQSSAPAASGEWFAQVERDFAKWDRDGDGELTPSELSQAVIDRTITGKSAAALATLIRLTRAKHFTAPALTLARLKPLSIGPRGMNQPDVGKIYAACLRQVTTIDRDLFTTTVPQLETIHQGRMGDCFCLAPLGAMLHRDAKSVVACFRKQPDGSYELKLGPHTQRVTLPTDTELLLSSSNEQAGIWVNLYEKAIGDLVNRLKPLNQQADIGLDALAKGGSSGRVLELITGHDVERFSFKFARDTNLSPKLRAEKVADFRAKLSLAFTQKRLVTAGTLKPATGTAMTPGLTPNHAYAVLGYDRARDEVRLWNPHGSRFEPQGKPGPKTGYSRQDGVFTMPLNEFVDLFGSCSIETNAPAK